MLISVEKLPNVVRDYVSEVMVPHAPSQLFQFGLGFAIPYIDSTVNNTIERYKNHLTLIGVIDSNNMIDITKAMSAASDALAMCNNSISIGNLIKLDKSDIDRIATIANRYAVNPVNTSAVGNSASQLM